MTDQNERLTPEQERLLDFSLGHRKGPADRTEAQALRALVQRVREARVSSPANPDRVQQVVMAARDAAEPQGLDVPSMWQLLEGRLRRSNLMRLVAASLIVHLCALPVLAWMHFSAPKRPVLNISFEQPEPTITSDPQPELLEPIDLDEVQNLVEEMGLNSDLADDSSVKELDDL